jgi:integrase
VDNLGWACELIEAPDLEAAGSIINVRLNNYVARGIPQTERSLAERVAFEHQVRSFLVRSNDRGYAFSRRFESMASQWVEFVNQNKACEQDLIKIGQRREYERGRAEASEALLNQWTTIHVAPQPDMPDATPVAPARRELPADVLAKIHGVGPAAAAALMVSKPAPLMPTPEPSPVLSVAATCPAPASPRLSEVMERFFDAKKKRAKDDRARGEYGPILQLMIDLLGDPEMDTITIDQIRLIDEALPDIPDRKSIPKEHCVSLVARYQYAQQRGWGGLKRLTVTTLKKYHYGIGSFFEWAITAGHYHGAKPKFETVSEENLAALPRDAFEDKELLDRVKLPLFTGCQSAARIWTAGEYFLQNHLYWGFLILILTGMRPGEVGQLRCRDVVTDGEFWFFDLRPFDARKGRVALKDLRRLKTGASARVVPIHPLLIELGLLDRVHELRARSIDALFPEWVPYQKKTGEMRWGQPITKAWQYIKTLLGITRADLTLYGTRHWMAEVLDSGTIAQRTRNRVLGHVGDIPDGYGRKGMLSPEQAAAFAALEPPVVKEMRAVLLATKDKADRKELAILKPWLRATKLG